MNMSAFDFDDAMLLPTGQDDYKMCGKQDPLGFLFDEHCVLPCVRGAASFDLEDLVAAAPLPFMDLTEMSTRTSPLELARVDDKPTALALRTDIEVSPAGSSCASPTGITDMLLTPTSKRSKPNARRAASMLQPHATEDATSTSSNVAWSDETILKMCGFAAEGEEPAPAPGSKEEDLEAKKMDRIHRNRVSAAQSRKRKRQHVEDLESLLASLKKDAQALQDDNAELRRQCAALADGVLDTLPPTEPAN